LLATFRRSALIIGVSASLLLHVLASVILYGAAPAAVPDPAEEPILVDFDMNEAPPPPEAEMPAAEDEPVGQPELPAEAAQPAEPEEPDETVPEPESEGPAVFDAAPPELDAGPADAMPADAGPADAGVGGEEVLAAKGEDAGAIDAGLLAGVKPGAEHDAAPVASSTPATAIDAGLPGATAASPTGATAAGPPGEGQAVAGTGTGAGTGVQGTSELNLLAYLPPGDVVSVLVRFDRLRGKPWAAQAEAILAPMPDYQSLVGDRKVTVSDLFDFLVISTPEPREVSATTLVGRTRLSGPEVRKFIDHRQAPVTWYTSRGGPAGRRTPSPLVHASDARMFVLPQPGWVVLAQPRHLGVLPQPIEGDIDMAMASPADVPAWLARAPAIDELTGDKQGPVLMLTIQGMLPPRYSAPYVGEIDTPKRLTLAVENARVGFFVRGAMLFESEAQAEGFIAAMNKAKVELTTTPMGKLLLNRFHVFHALRGLSFQRNKLKVAFATSISGNDARGLLARAAVQVRTYFEAQREPLKRLRRPRPAEPAPASPAPAPGPAPAPSPSPAPAPSPASPAPAPSPASPAPAPSPSPAPP
jgi:hypothetical protein